jgi:hypothetical protein
MVRRGVKPDRRSAARAWSGAGAGRVQQLSQPAPSLVQTMPSPQLPPPGQVGGSVQLVAPVQTVSQEQESLQSMPPVQVDCALHSTLQGPGPQTMWPAQLSRREQVMVQAVASPQSIAEPHEFIPAQLTAQAQPAGQRITSAPQESVPLQVMLQVVPVQLVQAGGQGTPESMSPPPASGSSLASGPGAPSPEGASADGPPSPSPPTHQPISQCRPPLHSSLVLQVSWSDRVSMLQPSQPASRRRAAAAQGTAFAVGRFTVGRFTVGRFTVGRRSSG